MVPLVYLAYGFQATFILLMVIILATVVPLLFSPKDYVEGTGRTGQQGMPKLLLFLVPASIVFLLTTILVKKDYLLVLLEVVITLGVFL